MYSAEGKNSPNVDQVDLESLGTHFGLDLDRNGVNSQAQAPCKRCLESVTSPNIRSSFLIYLGLLEGVEGTETNRKQTNGIVSTKNP